MTESARTSNIGKPLPDYNPEDSHLQIKTRLNSIMLYQKTLNIKIYNKLLYLLNCMGVTALGLRREERERKNCD